MSIGRNALYTVAGSIAPMFVSIVTVPVYLHLVGPVRYGVLSIVWLFLGYFGLFDPGLSQAATYHIARLHNRPAKERGDVFWTALAVNFCFGVAGGLVLFALARPVFLTFFKIPLALRAEVLASLPWLAAALPLTIMSGVLGSVLQAREWFGVSSLVRALNTFLIQVTPIFVAYLHGPQLTWLIPAILLARIAGLVPAFIAAALALPLGAGGGFKPALLPALFSYGGWIMITNLIMPVLSTADRMVIGSVLSAEAVTYYAVPFNLVSRFSVLPGALASSLFPRLIRSGANRRRVADDAVIGLAAVMTPLIALGILALPLFMRLWLGPAFARACTPCGMILFLGIWIRGLSYIPYMLLQAAKRPDLTAKCQAAELLPFLFVLWAGVHFFGLAGAAWAWTFRAVLDAGLLFALAGRLRTAMKLLPAAVLLTAAPACALWQWHSQNALLCVALFGGTMIWSWTAAPALRARLQAGCTRRLRLKHP